MTLLFPALGTAAIVIAAVLARRRRVRRARATGRTLRDSILRRELGDLSGTRPGTGAAASAALMDWNLGGDVATLAAFGDGTVSLYYSAGGGIIGAGTQATIREPALYFHELVTAGADRLLPETGQEVPEAGRVKFWLVRPGSTMCSQAFVVADVAIPSHPFSAAHDAAQATIAAIRHHQTGVPRAPGAS